MAKATNKRKREQEDADQDQQQAVDAQLSNEAASYHLGEGTGGSVPPYSEAWSGSNAGGDAQLVEALKQHNHPARQPTVEHNGHPNPYMSSIPAYSMAVPTSTESQVLAAQAAQATNNTATEASSGEAQPADADPSDQHQHQHPIQHLPDPHDVDHHTEELHPTTSDYPQPPPPVADMYPGADAQQELPDTQQQRSASQDGEYVEQKTEQTPGQPVDFDKTIRARKDNHKEVERRRRETINEGINRLAELVPGDEKNKGKILAGAIDFISQLKDNESQNIEKWTLEKLLTEQAIAELGKTVDSLRSEKRAIEGELAAWSAYGLRMGVAPGDVDRRTAAAAAAVAAATVVTSAGVGSGQTTLASATTAAAAATAAAANSAVDATAAASSGEHIKN